jgi:chloramphenicol 3-O-phosphotransferase
VILYGEPGTGKTLLAKAVANSTAATFLRVVGSELIQKYLGDGPKLVRELFRVADELAPSIVFIGARTLSRAPLHAPPSSPSAPLLHAAEPLVPPGEQTDNSPAFPREATPIKRSRMHAAAFALAGCSAAQGETAQQRRLHEHAF